MHFEDAYLYTWLILDSSVFFFSWWKSSQTLSYTELRYGWGLPRKEKGRSGVVSS